MKWSDTKHTCGFFSSFFSCKICYLYSLLEHFMVWSRKTLPSKSWSATFSVRLSRRFLLRRLRCTWPRCSSTRWSSRSTRSWSRSPTPDRSPHRSSSWRALPRLCRESRSPCPCLKLKRIERKKSLVFSFSSILYNHAQTITHIVVRLRAPVSLFHIAVPGGEGIAGSLSDVAIDVSSKSHWQSAGAGRREKRLNGWYAQPLMLLVLMLLVLVLLVLVL